MPVFRFAPSPNGRLHLGHAYSALFNEQLAIQMDGRFLVRLEDVDTTRCTTELAKECLADLAWLGLEWEQPVRVQSHHWNDYVRALATLKKQDLVYRCFCTRREIAQASSAFDPDGAPLYPGTCAKLMPEAVEARIAAGEPYCWRLSMEKSLQYAPILCTYKRFIPFTQSIEEIPAHPARWGDVVLARKEIPTSYHLSVVVDDAIQQITHVVRGADLEAATDLHVLLQTLLELPTPFYYHHALLTLPAGNKLSKSKGSESLADLRARGVSPQQVRQMVPFREYKVSDCLSERYGIKE